MYTYLPRKICSPIHWITHTHIHTHTHRRFTQRCHLTRMSSHLHFRMSSTTRHGRKRIKKSQNCVRSLRKKCSWQNTLERVRIIESKHRLSIIRLLLEISSWSYLHRLNKECAKNLQVHQERALEVKYSVCLEAESKQICGAMWWVSDDWIFYILLCVCVSFPELFFCFLFVSIPERKRERDTERRAHKILCASKTDNLILSSHVSCRRLSDTWMRAFVHTYMYAKTSTMTPLAIVSRSVQLRMRSPQPQITSVFPSTHWRKLPHLRVGGHSKFRPRHRAGLSIELNLLSGLSSAHHPSSETHEHMNLTVRMNSYLIQFFRRRNCLFSTTTPAESTRLFNDLATAEIPVPLVLLYLVSLCLGEPVYRPNDFFFAWPFTPTWLGERIVMSKGLLEIGSIFPQYSWTTLDFSARFSDEILEPHFAENSVCLSEQSRLVANGSVRMWIMRTPPDARVRSRITTSSCTRISSNVLADSCEFVSAKW